MGGDCILSAFIFSGVYSLKTVFKTLDQPYLTKTTACKFTASIVVLLLGFKLIVFSMSYDKC